VLLGAVAGQSKIKNKMKQKIALSSFMILATISAMTVGTIAFFSDTEQSLGNTFSAGTIDIAVDGQNPWVRSEALAINDMKPSQHAYTDYVIQNVGTNPANIFKKIHVAEELDGSITEPECIEGGGVWDAQENVCGEGYITKNDISSAIRYDMTVWIYDVDPKQNPSSSPKWWQIIYTDEMNQRLSVVNDLDVMLGMLPANWYMKVRQSYHMDNETTNWAQGDSLKFDVTLRAEQLTGVLKLQAKDFADQNNPTLRYDGKEGTMNYTVKDDKFRFDFAGVAPLANTNYSLIMYEEAFSTPSASGWPRDVIILASTTSDGLGNVSIPLTEIELGTILNMKVWLVKTADLDTVNSQMTAFNGPDYLFELGLIDYYDSI
jgi:predicted ribosomally synthesized peptide with SipW-like signal peptide